MFTNSLVKVLFAATVCDQARSVITATSWLIKDT